MESCYSISTKSPQRVITTKTFIADLPPVQCMKYDEDSNFMAAGCSDGKIAILTSARMHILNCSDSITSIC